MNQVNPDDLLKNIQSMKEGADRMFKEALKSLPEELKPLGNETVKSINEYFKTGDKSIIEKQIKKINDASERQGNR